MLITLLYFPASLSAGNKIRNKLDIYHHVLNINVNLRKIWKIISYNYNQAHVSAKEVGLGRHSLVVINRRHTDMNVQVLVPVQEMRFALLMTAPLVQINNLILEALN